MSERRRPSGPTEVPGWGLRMNEIIEHIWLLVRVSVLWAGLSLLGLVVLGIAPATCAAADALTAARRGDRVRPARLMWRSWREHLVRANVRMLPLMIVQAGAVATLRLLAAGAADGGAETLLVGAVAVVSAGWTTVALAAIVAAPRVRRQDLLVAWRLAVLMPGMLPGRAIGLLLLLVVWLYACLMLWPLALLLGAGVAADLATGILGRRIAELLEQIAGADVTSASSAPSS
ncbi:DUF624 domain-containing protein [Brachybacterium sp. DNPG3]